MATFLHCIRHRRQGSEWYKTKSLSTEVLVKGDKEEGRRGGGGRTIVVGHGVDCNESVELRESFLQQFAEGAGCQRHREPTHGQVKHGWLLASEGWE